MNGPETHGPTTDWLYVELDGLNEDGDSRTINTRLLNGVVEVKGFDRLERLSVNRAIDLWDTLRRTLTPVMDPPATPDVLPPKRVVAIREHMLDLSVVAADIEEVDALVESHEALRAEVERLQAVLDNPLDADETQALDGQPGRSFHPGFVFDVPAGTEIAVVLREPADSPALDGESG